MLYRSIFKSKLLEEKPKNNGSRTINEEKLTVDINNEKSLTIPNENSFRDEKLDNKIRKNILDFSKTSTGSKKTSNSKESQILFNVPMKEQEKIENFLMFSDTFTKHPFNYENEKKNNIQGKLTPKKQKINEEEKKVHFQPVPAKNYQGFSSSFSKVKTFIKSIENKNDLEPKLIPKESLNANNESKKKSNSSNKNSEEFTNKDCKKQQNIMTKPFMPNNNEVFEGVKGKCLDYYLKNGIFQTLIVEKSESGLLLEMLEKVKFNYYVCESIFEQRDEVKLFLTSNTHYKTSQRILILNNCKNWGLFIFIILE